MIRNAISALWGNFFCRVVVLVAICGAAPFLLLSTAYAYLIAS